MNKRPQGVIKGKRQELEDELTGKITDQQALVETGKNENKDDPFSKAREQEMHRFNIVQGRRRRHPKRVLQQHKAIDEQTENAESVWEKALLHDQERIGLSEEYKPKDHELVANQMGLVQTALTNFGRSKGRFTKTNIVGV